MEIQFLFEDLDVDEVSGFEMGDIVIEKGDFQVSSTNRSPNQSMMLFITVPQWLKAMQKMIESKKQEIQVDGVDSSYILNVRRKKRTYTICDDKYLIEGIEQGELLDSLYMAAERVWIQYGKYIQSDSVRCDFEHALENYRKFLRIINN